MKLQILGQPTKIRILDAAERLFARHGFEATSLRAIIVEAQVNLASVHYYYRSKEGLIRAVIERRFAPINQERLRLLDQCQLAPGDPPPSVEQIVEAFLLPMVSVGVKKSSHNSTLLQLGGRILLESGASFERIVAEQFKEVARRFFEAFQRALPHLAPNEIAWRMNFTIGATAKAMFAGIPMKVLSDAFQDVDEESEFKQIASRLIRFTVAGMKAPSSVTREDQGEILSI
jgi:AcrR family transcriptional regulator